MHPQVHRPYYKLVRAGMSTMGLGYFLLINKGVLVNSVKRIVLKANMQNLLPKYEEPNKHEHHFGF